MGFLFSFSAGRTPREACCLPALCHGDSSPREGVYKKPSWLQLHGIHLAPQRGVCGQIAFHGRERMEEQAVPHHGGHKSRGTGRA